MESAMSDLDVRAVNILHVVFVTAGRFCAPNCPHMHSFPTSSLANKCRLFGQLLSRDPDSAEPCLHVRCQQCLDGEERISA
jgi:hypothetical protein